MQIEEVVQYKVGAHFFSSKEEAEEYIKEKQLFSSLSDIVRRFFYRDIDEDDIVQGIIDNKKEITFFIAGK